MVRPLSLVCVSLALLLAPSAQAQKLYGLNGAAGLVHEFTLLPGAPCGQPTPTLVTWPYLVPPPCALVLPGPTPPPGPGSFGDIAANSLTDTVYVCDGFMIEQYSEFSPLAGTVSGGPMNAFPVPFVGPAIAPVTGMGMDEAGITTGGIPVLYLTDGALIWGIAPSPPGSCLPAPVVVPPFASPFPMPAAVILTDVTLDPGTGTLLACDSGGFIHSIAPGGFPGPYGFFPVVAPCPLGAGLEGIAMDLATTPSAFGFLPAFYVTDGFGVAYVDVTGGPAAPAFYTPVPCNGAPAPLNGLAYVNHSVAFGAAPGPAGLSSFGQPSSPGPSYGLMVTGVPAPAFAWLLYGTNVPGPGFFCPPIPAVGNPLYVDVFTPPGAVLGLFPVGPGATPFPAAIPPALPIGLELYLQVFLDLTPASPGGPWLSTNALDLVITAP